MDVPCGYSIFPNSVQLVSSELPLHDATNLVELSKGFLFRQIFSPKSKTFQCLLCQNKYILSSLSHLEDHYRVFHEFTVTTSIAQFHEDIVFIPVPSYIHEETTVKFKCCCCGTSLKTLLEIRAHYLNAHNKYIKVLPESVVAEVGKFFYCSLCGHQSIDFSSHHQHMRDKHRMQTYVCFDCTFCTSKPSCIMTDLKEKHLHDHPLQCSVCSVYVHGKDELINHMLSHGVQTENISRDKTN